MIGEARAGHPAAEAVRPGHGDADLDRGGAARGRGRRGPCGANDSAEGASSTVRVAGGREIGRPAPTSAGPARTFALGAVVLRARHRARPGRAGRGGVGRPGLAPLRPAPARRRAHHRRRAHASRRAARARAGSTARTASPSRAQVERAGGALAGRGTVPDTPEGTRAAIDEALEAADVVIVSGGVSVGPHDHVKDALRGPRRRGAFLGRAPAPGQAHLVRHARRYARVRPARQPRIGDGDLPALRAPRARGAPGRGAGRRARDRRARSRRRAQPAPRRRR